MENKSKISNLVVLAVILLAVLGIILYFFPNFSLTKISQTGKTFSPPTLERGDIHKFPTSFPKDLIFDKSPKILDNFTLEEEGAKSLIVRYSTSLSYTAALKVVDAYFASHNLAVIQRFTDGESFFRFVSQGLSVTFNRNQTGSGYFIEVSIITPTT